MSNDDLACLHLGRDLVRKIHDLQAMAKDRGNAYAERRITFPGGEVVLLVCSPIVAAAAKRGIEQAYHTVETVLMKDAEETKH